MLNKFLNNGKYTMGSVTFEKNCNVHFLKGENCRTPIKRKGRIQMSRATKEKLELAYVITMEKFLVRVNKLSPIRTEEWNR